MTEANFLKIKIDRNIISKERLNIENKIRSNLFKWNGQFSPQFVEEVLNQFCSKDTLVFDPFLGSGTTLYECARKGISAIGSEINPSAYYIAKVYEFCNISKSQRFYITNKVDDLLQTLSKDLSLIESLVYEIRVHQGDDYSNTLALILILLDNDIENISYDMIIKKWCKLKGTILNLPYSDKLVKAINKDARKTGLADRIIDLVFTSPPYINVFNYHQQYRKQIELLGYNVLDVSKSEFGSNRKNRGNRFLTVIQYCIDIALTIKELIRICKDDARIIFVVGRYSNVLKLQFSNSSLIHNIMTDVFNLEFIVRQERCFKNKFGQIIYEDIIHYKNITDKSSINEEEIIKKAQNIAHEALIEQYYNLNDDYKDKQLLFEAIKKYQTVKKSESYEVK